MINRNCHLIMRDLYSYDIVAAFPTIMSRQFYDFKGVSLSDKNQRNLFIGKEQISNPQLSSFLNESVKSLTDYYLRVNEVNEDQVIFRQKDGFILTTKLAKTDDYIEMKYRGMIDLMIIDTNRTAMIYFDDMGNMSVKGVKHYYRALDKIYSRFLTLNFYDKKTLFQQLEFLKNKVLKPSDVSLYGVELDGSYVFMLKGEKAIRVKDISFINPQDIDTRKYFNFYFKIFFDSIYLEVIR